MSAPLDTTEAIANAIRLLQAAEVETNLAIADACIRIADCWVAIANTLHEVG